MPAPAAPRKKGALTGNSTDPKTRSAIPATTTLRSNRATGLKGVTSDDDGLSARLEKVALDTINNEKPAKIAAPAASALVAPPPPSSTSRTVPRTRVNCSTSVSVKPATVKPKTSGPARPSKADESIVDIFSSINNCLAKLAEARKNAASPLSSDTKLILAVKDACMKVKPQFAKLRTYIPKTEQEKKLFEEQKLPLERAAVMLVSYCIDTAQWDLAVEQLVDIKGSIVTFYNTVPEATQTEEVLQRLEHLRLDEGSNASSRASTRSTPRSTQPSLKSASTVQTRVSSVSRRKTTEATASLITFPLPKLDSLFSDGTEGIHILILILIVQHQILACLFGQIAGRRSRKLTSSHETKRPQQNGTAIGTAAAMQSENDHRAILEALDCEGGPLTIYAQARIGRAPESTGKVDHYILTVYSLLMKKTEEEVATNDIEPVDALGLRVYALKCLLANESYFTIAHSAAGQDKASDNDKSVATLVNGLHRAIVSYGKMSTTRGVTEAHMAEQILQRMMPLMDEADRIVKPAERLTAMKSYIDSIDMLARLCEKIGWDSTSLRMRMQLRQPQSETGGNCCSTLECTTTPPSDRDLTVWRTTAISLCARLRQHAVEPKEKIEAEATEEERHAITLVQSLEEAHQILVQFDTWPDAKQDADVALVLQRVLRELERVHHFFHTSYKLHIRTHADSGQGSTDSQQEAGLLRLSITEICKFAVRVAACAAAQKLASRACDTLLLMAQSDFKLGDPSSYRTAYLCLEQACTLHDSMGRSLSSDRACSSIASASYQIGRALYNADKYANSLPFLQMCCAHLDKIVDHPCVQLSGDNNGGDMTEWTDLKKTCTAKRTSRWEVLGSAHAQCKEFHEAKDAYGQSIRSLILDLSASKSHVLAKSADMMRIVSKYTKLAILDLMEDPAEASLTRVCHEKYHLGIDVSDQAHILRLQSQSLRAHLDQDAAFTACEVWLTESASAFEAADAPLEAAHTLLQLLRISSFASMQMCTKTAEGLAARIAALCPDHNHGTSKRAKQYKAEANLCVALIIIRRREPQASKHLAKCSKAALPALLALVGPDSGRVSSGKQSRQVEAVQVYSPKKAVITSHGSPTYTKASKRSAAANRKPLLPKSQSPHNQERTPPRRGGTTTVDSTSHETPSQSPASGSLPSWIEDIEELLILLNTIAALLGIYEHSFLRISYLNIVKYLSLKSYADLYCLACLDLAYEYQQVGKLERASQVVQALRDSRALERSTPSAAVRYGLQQAFHLAYIGCVKESEEVYHQVLRSTTAPPDNENGVGGSRDRVVKRTCLLQETSLAAETYSHIAWQKGQSRAAIAAALQALRLSNRCLANFSRMRLQRDGDSKAHNSTAPVGVHAECVRERGKHNTSMQTFSSLPLFNMEWKLQQSLSRILLRLAALYETRGAVKLAMYFYSQAHDLAVSLNAPRLVSKVLFKRIQLGVRAAKMQDVERDTLHLRSLATEHGGLSSVELMYFDGQMAITNGEIEDGTSKFSSALTAFGKLDKAFQEADAPQTTSPRTSERPSPVRSLHKSSQDGKFLPELQSDILSAYAISAHGSGLEDIVADCLEKLRLSACTPVLVNERIMLEARLRLLQAFTQLREDPVAGLLHESVATVPVLITASHDAAEASRYSREKALATLSETELTLIGAACDYQPVSPVIRWRELTASLAQLRVVQANLGSPAVGCAQTLAATLEAMTAVAGRREMVDILNTKLTAGIMPNDLSWPEALPRTTTSKPESVKWLQWEKRYTANTTRGTFTPSALPSLLPSTWSILSIHATPDGQSLLAIRYESTRPPLVLQMPFDRLARREGDEEAFNLDVAQLEMKEIIVAANATSQNAVNVRTTEERREWWTQRKHLDARLARLLIGIEDKWFGAFKKLLLRTDDRIFSAMAIDKTLHKLEIFIRTTILTTRDSRSLYIAVDNVLAEALLRLPNDASDDELEDFFHFLVDSIQFAGIHVACDEIDVDHAVVDLRTLLEDCQSADIITGKGGHLFLILDKGLHIFPWESMPCLEGRSVSRVPSMEFIEDRLSMLAQDAREEEAKFVLNTSKTYYILNPGDDLKRTQAEFSHLVSAEGWPGIIGRVPLEEEMRRGLSSSDVLLYFGHGGAEQYIRPHVLQGLSSCATTFLWGCSSALMHEQGQFEEAGNPMLYMQAGAPSVVGNLWDVTDRDLDRFAKSTLEKFGLFNNTISDAVDLPSAVAASRQCCTLRYLNGAAPVVWGIPVCTGRLSSTSVPPVA